MSLKLITYDLHRPGQKGRLDAALALIGEVVHMSEASLVVDTPLSSNQVLTRLLKVIDLEDHVYVLELSSPWAAYGTEKVNDFLAGRL